MINYFEEDKEELTPAEILYGKRKNKEKDEEKPTGGASNVYMTPIEELYERNKEDKKNMTSIQNLLNGYKDKNPNPKYKFDNREISDNAIKKAREFIKEKENFRADAYKDSGGIWTIGYGHTKGVKQGDRITKAEAEKLYREDFKIHSDSLKHVKIPLSENQKAALASLIYNIGGTRFYKSDLCKKLNAGDIQGAAKEFETYIKDHKGKVQNGLIKRRRAEKELFLTPDDK